MAAFDPVKVLENVINRLRHHDPSGFFDDPVTDKEAPNYSQVITRPMSFSSMREKIRNREYRTWGAFVCDFELICANAVVYNQQKSKVHKAAKTMLRQGKIDLQDAGLEGRKAIYLLHPGGPAEAANEESLEFSAQGLAPPINAFLLCPGHTPLPPPPADEEDEKHTYYSCYSDTDSDDARGQGAPTLGDMDRFMKNLDKPVVWQPWSGAAGVSSLGPAKEEISPEWWKRRKPLEWQCRWLELRLLELQSHRHRYARSSKNPRNIPTASSGVSENGHHKKQKQKITRHLFPGISPDNLLKHPFLGLRGRPGKADGVPEAIDNMDLDRDKESSDEDSKALKTHKGVDQEDLCFGAQVHVALGVLTEEMKKVMGLLQARRKMCQSQQQLPLPRPLKKAVSMAPRKPIPRVDSKRSRRDFEMEDMVTPIGLAQTTATFERVPKTDIAVPRVVQLSADEQKQRQKALDVWRSLLMSDATIKTVPSEVSALLKSEEETSDEEFTDEAFLLRHKDMESTEHERHVSVFGPPKKQKEAASVPRVLQRSVSVPSASDASIVEPLLHGKSFPLSYFNDLGARGRNRGRRPILPQRPRPTMMQGARRGGMSIGIPMLTHTMPPLGQSQPLQSSSSMTVQGLAPLIPNLASLPAAMMTSMQHILHPNSSPMIVSSKPGEPIMSTGSQKYEDVQVPLGAKQAVMDLGISDPPITVFSSSRGFAVGQDAAAANFRAATSEMGLAGPDSLGNASSQAIGVHLVVRGQPAAQGPHSLPAVYQCEDLDDAQTDLEDDIAPEPDVCATQTEVVDSSPSRDLASIMQGSSIDWTKAAIAMSSAPAPDLEQATAQALMPVCSPPSVGLKSQALFQSSWKTQMSSALTSQMVPGIPCVLSQSTCPVQGDSAVVVDPSISPYSQLATPAARQPALQTSGNPLSTLPQPVDASGSMPAHVGADLHIPASNTPWAVSQEVECNPFAGLTPEPMAGNSLKPEDSLGNIERLPSGVLEIVEKQEQ